MSLLEREDVVGRANEFQFYIHEGNSSRFPFTSSFLGIG